MTGQPILNFNPDVAGDVDVDLKRLLAHKLAIAANSGGGKSWLLRSMLEQTHGHVQQLVFDPEGEFRTLREVFPDYIVVGGADTDLPIAPEKARVVMRELVLSGANIIVDLSEFEPEVERGQVIAGTIKAIMGLKSSQYRHMLIVVDEAHLAAPEQGQLDGYGRESLKACKDLASRGRKRGFGLVLSTQRLSQLDNTVLAMCNNRAFGLATLSNDRDRAGKELGFKPSERDQLRMLHPGEFFVFGPAISQEVLKVRSADVRSFHPEPGEVVPPAPPASEELQRLAQKLSSIEEPEADEEPASTTARPRVDIEKRVREAVAAATRPLEEKIEGLQDNVAAAGASIRTAITELDSAHAFLTSALNGRAKQAEPKPQPKPTPKLKKPAADRADAKVKRAAPVESTEVSGPQQKILDALATYAVFGQNVVDRRAACAFAGYKASGGYAQNIVSSLRTAGLVDYPAQGTLCLTPKGSHLANPTTVTSISDVHAKWFEICSGPQEKILRALISHYPRAITREQLGAETAYEPEGGYFQNIVSSLSTLGAVEYPQSGYVKATDLLFPEI